MEKSLSPGCQTFEQALFQMLVEDSITQDEAMINSDSATNLLWLINNTEAGVEMQKRKGMASTGGGSAKPQQTEAKPAEPPAEPGSFASFKLDA